MASRPPLNTGTLPSTRSAVPTVRDVTIRDINNAIGAVNQQLTLLNDLINQVNLKASTAQQSNAQGSITFSQLQQQLASLQSAVSAISTFSAEITVRADSAVTLFDVVYPTSSVGVSPVDTQDPTAIFGITGVATSAASAGGNVTVRRYGPVTVSGASFDIGRAVYAQIGEGLTQVPNYAKVAIPVGVAVAADIVEVRPGWPVLRERGLYPDTYEGLMPVALSLIEDVLDFVNSVFGQPDGIMVKVGAQILTREIVSPSGSGVSVADGDGVFGNPSIT